MQLLLHGNFNIHDATKLHATVACNFVASCMVGLSHYHFIPMYLHYKIIEFDWSAHFVTYLSEVRTFRLDLRT